MFRNIFNFSRIPKVLHNKHYLQTLSLPSRLGSEPGVDFNSDNWVNKVQLNKQDVSLDVIEYTRHKVWLKEANGFDDACKLLHNERKISNGVRWINVEGRNTDLMKELALKFKLHPLSIEDALYGDSATRPKAEYFVNNLFVTLPLHCLGNRFEQPTQMHEMFQNPNKNSHPLEIFNEKGEVIIDVQLISIFLMRDDTIISVFERPQPNVIEPMITRVREDGTVVRNSQDSSMVLQALLDVVVDHAISVTSALEKKLHVLDQQVLEIPTMETIRSLYKLRGQLLELKRTLTPLQNLIITLKEFDTQRDAFVSSDEHSKGYISPKAQVYLQDVEDHIDWVLSALDMYSNLATNMVNFSFNASSFRLNESIKTLTVFSVICLPLSLITSYFGMNFETFPSLANHVNHFWYLAFITSLLTVTGIYLPQIKSKLIARKTMNKRGQILKIEQSKLNKKFEY